MKKEISWYINAFKYSLVCNNNQCLKACQSVQMCMFSLLVPHSLTLTVSWYFEPSQTQQITSGLKTNCNLSPIYYEHKSSNHKFSKIAKSIPKQIYIKQKIHKHQTQNFRSSPFGIAPSFSLSLLNTQNANDEDRERHVFVIKYNRSVDSDYY